MARMKKNENKTTIRVMVDSNNLDIFNALLLLTHQNAGDFFDKSINSFIEENKKIINLDMIPKKK